MADNLLENYNPLYDIHLRQYFASPHMQKHLRSMGIIDNDGKPVGEQGEVYARHHMMMNMMLKNREQQLMKLADLQKKLDAAEKVEIYRRIRSGQSPESFRRTKASRSLSRGRPAVREIESKRQRRFSNSYDDQEVITKIEKVRQLDTEGEHTGDPYARLSAKASKYRYLHKLDDNTLVKYTDQLKRELDRLERFRAVSFGVHSVARQPPPASQSWFFRRRSLPSLTQSAPANALHEPLRSINSLRGRKAHISPRGNRLNQSHDSRTSCPPTVRQRHHSGSNSRLPPIQKKNVVKSAATTSHASRTPKLPPASQSRNFVAREPRKSREPLKVPNTATTTMTRKPVEKLPALTAVGVGITAVAAGAAVAVAAATDENESCRFINDGISVPTPDLNGNAGESQFREARVPSPVEPEELQDVVDKESIEEPENIKEKSPSPVEVRSPSPYSQATPVHDADSRNSSPVYDENDENEQGPKSPPASPIEGIPIQNDNEITIEPSVTAEPVQDESPMAQSPEEDVSEKMEMHHIEPSHAVNENQEAFNDVEEVIEKQEARVLNVPEITETAASECNYNSDDNLSTDSMVIHDDVESSKDEPLGDRVIDDQYYHEETTTEKDEDLNGNLGLHHHDPMIESYYQMENDERDIQRAGSEGASSPATEGADSIASPENDKVTSDHAGSPIVEDISIHSNHRESIHSEKAVSPPGVDVISHHAERVSSPAQDIMSIQSDYGTSLHDSSSPVTDKVSSPVAHIHDVTDVASVHSEKLANEVEDVVSDHSENAVSPVHDVNTVLLNDVDDSTSIHSEKIASPVDYELSNHPEQLESPIRDAVSIHSEHAISPVHDSESIQSDHAADAISIHSEKVSCSVEDVVSHHSDNVASPVHAESIHSDHAADAVSIHSEIVAADAVPHISDQAASPVHDVVSTHSDDAPDVASIHTEKISTPVDYSENASSPVHDSGSAHYDLDVEAASVHSENVASPHENEISHHYEQQRSPIHDAASIDTQGLTSPVHDMASVKSDDAADAASIHSEKVSSPFDGVISHHSEQLASPIHDDIPIHSEHVPSPIQDAASIHSGHNEDVLSIHSDKVSTPVADVASHHSENAASPVLDDASIHSEHLTSPMHDVASIHSDHAMDSASIHSEKVSSPVDDVLSHHFEHVESPIHDVASIHSEHVGSPALDATSVHSGHGFDTASVHSEKISSPIEDVVSHHSEYVGSPAGAPSIQSDRASLRSEKIPSPAPSTGSQQFDQDHQEIASVHTEHHSAHDVIRSSIDDIASSTDAVMDAFNAKLTEMEDFMRPTSLLGDVVPSAHLTAKATDGDHSIHSSEEGSAVGEPKITEEEFDDGNGHVYRRTAHQEYSQGGAQYYNHSETEITTKVLHASDSDSPLLQRNADSASDLSEEQQSHI